MVSSDAVERRPRLQVLGGGVAVPDDEWIVRLSTTGPVRDEAVALLHDLMLRAARHQVSRASDAARLGPATRDEVAHAAADEATVSALGRLESFEGRSRFTTWAYKFGILQAGVELRRAVWRDRDVTLEDVTEPAVSVAASPEAHVEGNDLAWAVRDGLFEALTEHQRRVAFALLVDEVPIDVLADRLETTRNALYKTLHEVRRKLRSHLAAQGFHAGGTLGEEAR